MTLTVRDSMARFVTARDAARMASAMPGACRVAAAKERAYRQRRKINALGDDVFSKIAVRHGRAAAAKFFYFFLRQ